MMTSYESMKQKHEQTGLYCVSENSNISCELKAYAAGLDILWAELEKIERECYVVTAEDYGLSKREEFLGYDRQQLGLEERRNLLCTAEQVNGECTVEAFNRMIESFGVSDFNITQRYAQNSVVVFVYESLTEAQKARLETGINENFPAHLNINVYYTSH